MTRQFAPISILSFCMALGFVGASAALTPLSDDDLSDLRGGFVTVDGLTFGLGITVSTAVNGQQILQNTLTLPDALPKSVTTPVMVTPVVVTPVAPVAVTAVAVTPVGGAIPVVTAAPAGVTTQFVVATPAGLVMPAGGTTPVVAATPAGVTTQLVVATPVGGATPAVAATPSDMTTPAGGATAPSTTAVSSTIAPATATPSFLVSSDGARSVAASPDGKTIIIQNLNPAQLTNMVINSANNQSIRQDIQVNIVLPGFSAIQQSHTLSVIGMHINADGGIGIVGSLSH